MIFSVKTRKLIVDKKEADTEKFRIRSSDDEFLVGEKIYSPSQVISYEPLSQNIFTFADNSILFQLSRVDKPGRVIYPTMYYAICKLKLHIHASTMLREDFTLHKAFKYNK